MHESRYWVCLKSLFWHIFCPYLPAILNSPYCMLFFWCISYTCSIFSKSSLHLILVNLLVILPFAFNFIFIDLLMLEERALWAAQYLYGKSVCQWHAQWGVTSYRHIHWVNFCSVIHSVHIIVLGWEPIPPFSVFWQCGSVILGWSVCLQLFLSAVFKKCSTWTKTISGFLQLLYNQGANLYCAQI